MGTDRKSPREVTVASIVFGIIVGVIMNASITYSGLKIGFTIVGSAIAAVLGFGILRGLLRRGSILETNIAQTIASSVNSTNSGVIFTVPVLLLLGYSLSPAEPRFWLVTLACMAGATMGAAFIIPLRKQMIDIDRLRFPSGTAVGAILKSPGAGVKKSLVLAVGMLVSMLLYLPTGLTNIKSELDPANLEYYVDTGRIGAADAEMTRTLATWIEGEATMPDLLVERGGHLLALEDEDSTNDEAATASLDAMEASPFSDKLAMQAARIDAGQADLESLRDKDFGWATASTFWGYRDIGIETLGDDAFDLGSALGLPPAMHLVFAIAPFAIGAGYLSGRAGLMVTAGGVLAYLVLNPTLHSMGLLPSSVSPEQVASSWGRGNIGKPLGIGLLCGGALMGVIVTLPMIKAALASLLAAAGSGRSTDELGMKTLATATLGAFTLLFVTSFFSESEASNRVCPVTNTTLVSVGTPEPRDLPHAEFGGYSLQFENEAALATWEGWDDATKLERLKAINSAPGLLSGMPTAARALLIAIVGSVWIWFAGIVIAQCTGMTDWSPISGIALLTVVLVLMLAGVGAVIPAVLIGATLCCAITMSADMMADLRTGYIVGSIPKRQQTVELLTTWVGPVVCMMTVLLIAQATTENFGRPMGEGTDIPAAQAVALHSIITGVQGGDLPYVLYGLGGLLGIFMGLGSFPGLGVLVGLSMYLPFMYISTYGIGCIANMVIGKIKGRAWAEEWGVPFAAGLIVGEAVLSLVINALVVIRQQLGA